MSKNILKKKVAVYIRVSSTKQAETGQGEKVQKDNCLDVIQRNGWELYKIYFDPKGISGDTKVKHRVEFMELMEDAKNKKFSIFLVNNLDRLGRKNKVMTKGLDMLFAAGISVFAGTTRIENTLYGRLISGITGEIAQYDKEQILTRMREGLEKATQQRGERQGKVPYGYKRIGKSKNTKIEINEPEAEVIRFIYEERNKGLTLQKIANILNENGIRASRSLTWDHKKIQRILSEISRETYCGGMRNGWNELNVCWPQILPDKYKIKEEQILTKEELPKLPSFPVLETESEKKSNSLLLPILVSKEVEEIKEVKKIKEIKVENFSELIPL